MKRIIKLLNWVLSLQFVFDPRYCVMLKPYAEEVDDYMNYLLETYEFTDIGECTAKLGDVEIWIANQPYACMMPSKPSPLNYFRPSKLTISRGLKKLNKTILANNSEILRVKRIKMQQEIHKLEQKMLWE